MSANWCSSILPCSTGVSRVFLVYCGINSRSSRFAACWFRKSGTYSLGHLFVSPQAPSEFEFKMALAWSKCTRSLAKIRLHCRLVPSSRKNYQFIQQNRYDAINLELSPIRIQHAFFTNYYRDDTVEWLLVWLGLTAGKVFGCPSRGTNKVKLETR